MNRKRFLASIIMITIVFTGNCQENSNVPSPLSARLSEVSGKVDARQGDQETFNPASTDTVLDVNGQVQTGSNGRVRLDLSTGTIIRVGPSSLFTLVLNTEEDGSLVTKLKMEFGRVFIILKGGSAEVETPSGIASVRGSFMKVEVNPETLDIYVTCLEGDCSASNPAGTVNFSDGQKTILFHRDPVTGNWTPPNVEPMTPDEFQEWLDENPEAKELFDQAMATLTALVPSTEPPIATFTPSLTASPTLETVVPPGPSSSACFEIIQPRSGVSLPKLGQVTFEWAPQPGAQYYVMTFIDAFNRQATIQTENTNTAIYVEIFPNGGEHNWFVTAFDSDGSEICSTTGASFTKPQGDPTPVPSRTPKPTQSAPACVYPDDVCDPNNIECYDEGAAC